MDKKTTEGCIVAVFAIAGATLIGILNPLLYAAGGYFTGWALSVLFTFTGKWVVLGAHAIGMGITIGQLPVIGAMLGFIGAFFKSTQTNKNGGK